MIIKLSPQRRDDTLVLTKNGDTLIINGEAFDFSRMGSGDTLPVTAIASQWFVEDVERDENGKLIVTLLLPNPRNYSPEQAFPADLVGVPNGEVVLPGPLLEEMEVTDEH
jgi:hypothetical protein